MKIFIFDKPSIGVDKEFRFIDDEEISKKSLCELMRICYIVFYNYNTDEYIYHNVIYKYSHNNPVRCMVLLLETLYDISIRHAVYYGDDKKYIIKNLLIDNYMYFIKFAKGYLNKESYNIIPYLIISTLDNVNFLNHQERQQLIRNLEKYMNE